MTLAPFRDMLSIQRGGALNLDNNELPHVIIGACMEVHRTLGPGLMVEAYRAALAHELRMREIIFQRDRRVEVAYKGAWIDCGFDIEFLIENLIIVHVHAVDELLPLHKERMKSYLKLTGYETGLIINFNTSDLRKGVKRIIVSSSEPTVRYK